MHESESGNVRSRKAPNQIFMFILKAILTTMAQTHYDFQAFYYSHLAYDKNKGASKPNELPLWFVSDY